MIKKSVFILLSFFIAHTIYAQDYKHVQVSLRDGQTYKGKNGIISEGALTFTSGSMQKTYSLTDVNIIQAKEGKALKWALGCGGGCLAIGLITTATQAGKYNDISGETYSAGTLLAGSLIWAGAFAGVGALIGSLTDPWKIVYNRSSASIWNDLDLNLAPDPFTGVNLTLSYKFPNRP
ncbi:MAG TPA: hypothetical protein ENO20_11720 [Bacteroides sp.]|nr:hypothetical protein [Bacteroides sp.]